jgi:hypothetical protein
MNSAGQLEELLANLFRYGSWLAAAAIGLGFTLASIGADSAIGNVETAPTLRIATAGIILFILLPVVRVLLMVIVLTRQGDLRLACIAALVLAIILLGMILGSPAKTGGTG